MIETPFYVVILYRGDISRLNDMITARIKTPNLPAPLAR